MALIGIDLGTTNSLAAVWRGGRCQLVPGALGDELIPSVVSVAEDGSILTGEAARQRLVSHPERTATNFKQFMGTQKDYRLAGQDFRPEDLSSFVLRALKADAEAFLGEAVTEAVISVPAYFNDTQRSATKIAGQLAGFKVERIINEPSAAALAYQHATGSDGIYLVFDFGGGTLDISVVELFENIVDVTAVAGDNHLGGSDIDAAILAAFCEENPGLAAGLSATERASLLKVAERCKMALTDAPATLMVFQRGDERWAMELTGAKLADICSVVLSRIREVMHRALQDTGRSIAAIDNVVLVGGSCRMPLVQQYIEYLTGQVPLSGIDPDRAVALGAGIMAGIKSRDIRDMVLTDICPFSLGVAVAQAGQLAFSPIITRNSALPVSRQQRYSNVDNMQQLVAVEIYQGESFHVEENLYLGKIEMPIPPMPPGEAKVDVRFTYDINGILEVDVHCEQNGGAAHKLIVSNPSLSPDEVAKRVTELQAIKVAPRDQAENALLIARAERQYQEHTGLLRDQIGLALQRFLHLIEQQENPGAAGRARSDLDALLERVDAFDDGLMDPEWDGEDELDEYDDEDGEEGMAF